MKSVRAVHLIRQCLRLYGSSSLQLMVKQFIFALAKNATFFLLININLNEILAFVTINFIILYSQKDKILSEIKK